MQIHDRSAPKASRAHVDIHVDIHMISMFLSLSLSLSFSRSRFLSLSLSDSLSVNIYPFLPLFLVLSLALFPAHPSRPPLYLRYDLGRGASMPGEDMKEKSNTQQHGAPEAQAPSDRCLTHVSVLYVCLFSMCVYCVYACVWCVCVSLCVCMYLFVFAGVRLRVRICIYT